MALELASGSAREPGISALFQGASVVNHSGEAVSVISLKDKSVLLYFAASWAEPCRHFNALLAKFYDMVRAVDSSIVVIFVSSDKSMEEQDAFFKTAGMHAEWLMVSYSDELESLMTTFGVEKIPSLIVVDRDGRGVVKDAQDQLYDLLQDKQGRLMDPEEAKPAVAAKWDEWRRLAGDWCAKDGYMLGGGVDSHLPRGGAGTRPSLSVARNDREALRAARLAAMESHGGVAGVGNLGGSSGSAPSAPSDLGLEHSASSSSATAIAGAVHVATDGGTGAAPQGSSSSGSGAFVGCGLLPGAAAHAFADSHLQVPQPAAPAGSDCGRSDLFSDMASDGAESAVGDPEIDMDQAVEQLASMGIPEQLARETLEATHGNISEAIGRLFED